MNICVHLFFPGYSCGLVHGRMKGQEKAEVMEKFRLGKIQLLVATSVIEVGINVPKATVMFVHGADRFGLSQLHQSVDVSEGAVPNLTVFIIRIRKMRVPSPYVLD